MDHIQVNIDHLKNFISKDQVYAFRDEITDHIDAISNKTGKG